MEPTTNGNPHRTPDSRTTSSAYHDPISIPGYLLSVDMIQDDPGSIRSSYVSFTDHALYCAQVAYGNVVTTEKPLAPKDLDKKVKMFALSSPAREAYESFSNTMSPLRFASAFSIVKAPEEPARIRLTKPGPLAFEIEPVKPEWGRTVAVLAQRKYKPVAKKVRPVPATLPAEFRIERNIKGDPLESMPVLSRNPPEYTPCQRYTPERKEYVDSQHPGDFLWPEERKLMHHFMMVQEMGFAWDDTEKGKFNEEYFPPVNMAVLPHTPWVLKNIPIPPGLLQQVIETVRTKIAAGTYEPSNSSYRSRWFAVAKKDTDAVRLVHDLQLLNKYTIQDSGMPPHVDTLGDSCGGKACYGILDLFVGYDERTLALASRDYTTFQTPLGTLRLTKLPMGWTNSVPVFHGDVVYTLRDEIPQVTVPFIDDAPVLGPASRYELEGGGYETIPENAGIRRFVWEHFQNLNRVVQRIKYVGCTWSGKKAYLCVPELLIVGHLCCYEGRRADRTKVAKVANWAPCQDLSDVRAFLGTAGLMRIFIKDFAKIARPLVDLTRKGTEFVFGEAEREAQRQLIKAVVESPAVKPINYLSDDKVILAVDTSVIAIGYVLSQMQPGSSTKRFPSRFGSIPISERESHYSQPKLELYGLYRSLRATRLYIVGVRNLVVEVDAKYIKGMLNNPDIQPTATVNRWIAGILLYHFELVHVPGKTHGPDGLSRRKPQEDDEPEPEEKDWVDEVYGLMHIINDMPLVQGSNRQVIQLLQGPEPLAVFALSEADKAKVIQPYSAEQLETQQVPRTKKSMAKDIRLGDVLQVLRDLTRPEGYSDDQYRNLIRYTQNFFQVNGRLWRRDEQGQPKIYIAWEKRFDLLKQAHDDLGHKGADATAAFLRERFWWPMMNQDARWYATTCHLCQIRQTRRIIIPPTVQMPYPLFTKFYCDTMHMPLCDGKTYLVHGRCSLSGYPEYRALASENGESIADWIFEDVICRWGSLYEIVTDNGSVYLKALKILRDRYNLHHISISGYNSRANGIIERKHYDVRESLFKAADGAQNKWVRVAPSVFWAERVTTRRLMGCSPYFAAHGVHPILPFDISEATYLMPPPDSVVTSEDLIVRRAISLQKRQSMLRTLRTKVFEARMARIRLFEEQYKNLIYDYNFPRGSLILVRNTRIEAELNKKMKPRYLGPVIVLSRNQGGAYIVCELDGSVWQAEPVGAFRCIPYFARVKLALPEGHDWLDVTPDRLKQLEESTEAAEGDVY